MTRVLAAVGAVVFAVFVAEVRYGPIDLRPRRHHCRCARRSPMPAHSRQHPQLRCWVCGGPASQVLEATPADPLDPDGPFRQYSCHAKTCEGLSVMYANSKDCVHMSTRPLEVAVCVGGLIESYGGDGERELWACHGCPGCQGVAS